MSLPNKAGCVFALMLLLALFSVSVFSFSGRDVLVPSSIDFFGGPEELSLVIDNTSSVSKSFSIRVFVPSGVEVFFFKEYSNIPAATRLKMTALLSPSNKLSNMSYNGLIEVNLGGEIAMKNIKLNFYPVYPSQPSDADSGADVSNGSGLNDSNSGDLNAVDLSDDSNSSNDLNADNDNPAIFAVFPFDDSEVGTVNLLLIALIIVLLIVFVLQYYNFKMSKQREKEEALFKA